MFDKESSEIYKLEENCPPYPWFILLMFWLHITEKNLTTFTPVCIFTHTFLLYIKKILVWDHYNLYLQDTIQPTLYCRTFKVIFSLKSHSKGCSSKILSLWYKTLIIIFYNHLLISVFLTKKKVLSFKSPTHTNRLVYLAIIHFYSEICLCKEERLKLIIGHRCWLYYNFVAFQKSQPNICYKPLLLLLISLENNFL